MQVRGAPLIALVACLGLSVHLKAKQKSFKDLEDAKTFILESISYLRESRPTAVNLFVATDELRYRINILVSCRCFNFSLIDHWSILFAKKMEQQSMKYVVQSLLLLSSCLPMISKTTSPWAIMGLEKYCRCAAEIKFE